MKMWKFAVAALVIVLFAAWYAFRPEGLFIDRRVQEELPTARGGSSLQSVASGSFHSVIHPTQGTATIYQIGDGGRVLRFTNFKTTNGPNVHVYMVAADDANDSASVLHAGFIAAISPATELRALQAGAHRRPRKETGYLSGRHLQLYATSRRRRGRSPDGLKERSRG
jgi:hypothetical protein